MIGRFTFQAPSNILFEAGASRKIGDWWQAMAPSASCW